MYNLYYLAKPTHGGYVTFNAHLLYNLDRNFVYKISGKIENKPRDLGWGKSYKNVDIRFLAADNNFVITALEKSHYDLLPFLEHKNLILITHDTVELKSEAIDAIKRNKGWKIIAIRQKIKEYLADKHGIESEYVYHPFHEYDYYNLNVNKSGSISISRVDFDKHTEIIIFANKLLEEKDKINIYGKKNSIYEYHNLDPLLEEHHKPFSKNYPYYFGPLNKSFTELSYLLQKSKFMVDMSIISGDGGGTQYTFLEAIHNNIPIILNSKWNTENSDFEHNYNCYFVNDEKELANLVKRYDKLDIKRITENAKKLMERHVKVNWSEKLKC